MWQKAAASLLGSMPPQLTGFSCQGLCSHRVSERQVPSQVSLLCLFPHFTCFAGLSLPSLSPSLHRWYKYLDRLEQGTPLLTGQFCVVHISTREESSSGRSHRHHHHQWLLLLLPGLELIFPGWSLCSQVLSQSSWTFCHRIVSLSNSYPPILVLHLSPLLAQMNPVIAVNFPCTALPMPSVSSETLRHLGTFKWEIRLKEYN